MLNVRSRAEPAAVGHMCLPSLFFSSPRWLARNKKEKSMEPLDHRVYQYGFSMNAVVVI